MSRGDFVIIGGAAVFVVAAPVTGIIMYVLTKSKIKAAEKRGERRGAAEEKARNEETHQCDNKRFETISSQFGETKAMFDYVLALTSVGYACAASNGPVTAEEACLIDEFIMGVCKHMLPAHIQDAMGLAASNPPDIRTAYDHAEKTVKTIARDTWPWFDEIVTLVARIDEPIPREKVSFMSEWRYLRASSLRNLP